MKRIILLFLLPSVVFAWDFTQERNTIPVEFDSVQCQVPWTTGYNYINPTFCDIDDDNDYDLIFGSDWARISFYRNDGEFFSPEFVFMTDSLVSPPGLEPYSQVPNRPIFCDIDSDNDFDLFVGAYLYYPISYGRLFFYENTGNNQSPNYLLIEEFFQGIEYPYCQYPFFVDIDNDEDYDLFLGVGSRISFYINEGTPDSVSMVFVTDYFMNIDLGGYYAIPAFCDIDADGDYDMFLGDEDGLIHYYRNDGTPEVYDFIEVTSNYAGVDVANIASPVFCDIDGDGDYDLFVGERSWGEDNRHGDINFYENTGTPGLAVFELVTQNFLTVDIGLSASPSFADIDNDGSIDMFLSEIDGNINYFSNIGSAENPSYILEEEMFSNIYATYNTRSTFGDLDNDGDLDLLVGRVYYFDATIMLYRNDGTPESPDFTLITNDYLGPLWGRQSPRLVDIDNDSDLDLFIGKDSNRVEYWENQGDPFIPQHVLVNDNYFNDPIISYDYSTICLGDIDNDGDYDLLRGYSYGTLSFYRNAGTSVNPNIYLEEDNFLGIESVHQVEPFIVDIDNDNDMDLFVGDFCGGVSFWRNNEISNVVDKTILSPYDFSLGQNYPNPFNVMTTIPFTLDRALPVRVVVYNGLGQCVATLIDKQMSPGQHQLRWDAGMCSSGVYLIALESESIPSQARKVLLIK